MPHRVAFLALMHDAGPGIEDNLVTSCARARTQSRPGQPPNPRLFVLKDQLDDVKAALIRSGVLFAIDPQDIYKEGARSCVIYFRPNVDAKAVEAKLAKA